MIQFLNIDRPEADMKIFPTPDSFSETERQEPDFMKMLKAAIEDEGNPAQRVADGSSKESEREQFNASQPKRENIGQKEINKEQAAYDNAQKNEQAQLKGKPHEGKDEVPAKNEQDKSDKKAQAARNLNPEALDGVLDGLTKNGTFNFEEKRLITEALPHPAVFQKENLSEGRLNRLIGLFRQAAKAAEKKEPAAAKLLAEKALALEASARAKKARAGKLHETGRAGGGEKSRFLFPSFSDTEEKNEAERLIFKTVDYERNSSQKLSAADWKAFGLGSGEAPYAKAAFAAAGAGKPFQNQLPKFQEQLQSLIDGAKLYVRDGKNAEINLNLYPKSLGTVTLNLGLEQGILNGRFVVDSPEVKEMLYINLESIRQQLEEAGISVGEFQVNVRGEGRQYGDVDAENIFLGGTASNEGEQAAAAYESNSVSLHNGSVNLVV